jgi:hypothetical protein
MSALTTIKEKLAALLGRNDGTSAGTAAGPHPTRTTALDENLHHGGEPSRQEPDTE